MDDVKRYRPPFMFSTQRPGEMEDRTDGDYVRYDDYAALRARLEAVEKERDQIAQSLHAELGAVADWKARAERAEAALKEAEKDRDQWQRKHESQLKVDFDLVEKYRRPKSGNFHFPEDVAHIIRKLDAAEAALATARREAVGLCRDIAMQALTGDADGRDIYEQIDALANEAET